MERGETIKVMRKPLSSGLPNSKLLWHWNVHRVTRTYVQTQVKCTEEGDRGDSFQVHSFDQGICTYVWVTGCAPEKGKIFPFLFRNFTAR